MDFPLQQWFPKHEPRTTILETLLYSKMWLLARREHEMVTMSRGIVRHEEYFNCFKFTLNFISQGHEATFPELCSVCVKF